MIRVLKQSVFFKNASPKKLYETYTKSKKHAAAINDKASIEDKVGGTFKAFGMLKGKFLLLKKNTMVVQTWRSSNFGKKDEDSVLVLTFEKVKGGARLNLLHAGLPEKEYAKVETGWAKHYWTPWQKYLAGSK